MQVCTFPVAHWSGGRIILNMQQTLSVLVLIGLILWMFLLYEKTHPMDALNKVDNANTSARCAQFGYDVEGERNLSYADRIRQLVRGCW